MEDSAILFKLNSGKCAFPPGLLLTPKMMEKINRCRCCEGKNGPVVTFVSIDYEIYNLCDKCSKVICVKCTDKTTHAFDSLGHICNKCNY